MVTPWDNNTISIGKMSYVSVIAVKIRIIVENIV
jgi:hypothetical protein